MSSIEISFVISSKRPKALAEFYSNVSQIDFIKGIDSNHYLLPIKDGFLLQIYRPSSTRDWPNKGRSMSICFQKKPAIEPMSVLEEWSYHLTRLGGSICEEPRNEPYGAETWVADPEGNDFLILVPSISKNIII
tara:strand:- start:4847 stop:5248 length:402 start_codon:yes stop_codon:yes gene_type:complete